MILGHNLTERNESTNSAAAALTNYLCKYPNGDKSAQERERQVRLWILAQWLKVLCRW
jgi:hypothetical protein